MPRYNFVSAQARAFSFQSKVVRRKIWDNNNKMDKSTRTVFIGTLVEKIRDIESVLQNQAVRGHLDTSFRSQDVDELSSINSLLICLKRQVSAASVLADVCHQGPAANAEEQVALSRVQRALDILDDAISLPIE